LVAFISEFQDSTAMPSVTQDGRDAPVSEKALGIQEG
jgi:hypothetical protein